MSRKYACVRHGSPRVPHTLPDIDPSHVLTLDPRSLLPGSDLVGTSLLVPTAHSLASCLAISAHCARTPKHAAFPSNTEKEHNQDAKHTNTHRHRKLEGPGRGSGASGGLKHTVRRCRRRGCAGRGRRVRSGVPGWLRAVYKAWGVTGASCWCGGARLGGAQVDRSRGGRAYVRLPRQPARPASGLERPLHGFSPHHPAPFALLSD
ncbi:hypothetical protein BD413DRAFT_207236 [Trametes elegans]|nr:hypothetical protein BD413DRAFT_207236 [Trametes elegans]